MIHQREASPNFLHEVVVRIVSDNKKALLERFEDEEEGKKVFEKVVGDVLEATFGEMEELRKQAADAIDQLNLESDEILNFNYEL